MRQSEMEALHTMVQAKVDEILVILKEAGLDRGYIEVDAPHVYVSDSYDWNPSSDWSHSSC